MSAPSDFSNTHSQSYGTQDAGAGSGSNDSEQSSLVDYAVFFGRTVVEENECLIADETSFDQHGGAAYYHGNAHPKKSPSFAREIHQSRDRALQNKNSHEKNGKSGVKGRTVSNKSHEKKEMSEAELALKTLKKAMAFYNKLKDDEVVEHFNAPDSSEYENSSIKYGNSSEYGKKSVLSRIQSIYNSTYLCKSKNFSTIDARRQLCMFIQLRNPDLASQALDSLHLILERHFILLNEKNASFIFKDFLYFSRIMAGQFSDLNRTNKIKAAKVFAQFAEIVINHQKCVHTHAMPKDTWLEIGRVYEMMRNANIEIEDLELLFYTSLAEQAIARIKTNSEIAIELLGRGYHLVKAVANAYVKNAPGVFAELEATLSNLLLLLTRKWGETVLNLRTDFRVALDEPVKMANVNQRIEELIASKKWKYAYAAADLITLKFLYEKNASCSTEEDLKICLNNLQKLSRTEELPERSPIFYILKNGKRLEENENVPTVNTNEGARITANKALNRISLFATDPEVQKIARSVLAINIKDEDLPKVKKDLDLISPKSSNLINWINQTDKYERHKSISSFERIAFVSSKDTGKIISELIHFGQMIDLEPSKHTESKKLDSKRVKKGHHKPPSQGSSHKKERHKTSSEKSDSKKPEKDNSKKNHKSGGHKSHKG